MLPRNTPPPERQQTTSTNTDAQSDTGNASARPHAIALPKGGGAIRGIGEKFAANPVTGTGSMTVPIATSPGRSGFGPQLAISYDSGAGNGPFGFGWHLSVPAITHKTDKGLPRYHDEDESDIFILSEAEDLVPALLPSGDRDTFQATLNSPTYTVRRYRPRIEGLFTRIKRWRSNATGETHWRAISKDNITSVYGNSPSSRIADPDDAARVFSWLLALSYDDKGNLIVYEHKAEDQANVAPVLHEQNRTITANRYLKSITYGYQSPYYPDHAAPQPPPLPTDWHFQVVFDYGEHDPEDPTVDDDGTSTWPGRPDAFSSYRAGFEIRTYRLCRRVLMFHQFTELGVEPCLVRSTEFLYSHEQDPANPLNPIYSFLASVTQTGYVRHADGSGYNRTSLPPLEFAYTEARVDEDVQSVDADSLENLRRCRRHGLSMGRPG